VAEIEKFPQLEIPRIKDGITGQRLVEELGGRNTFKYTKITA